MRDRSKICGRDPIDIAPHPTPPFRPLEEYHGFLRRVHSGVGIGQTGKALSSPPRRFFLCPPDSRARAFENEFRSTLGVFGTQFFISSPPSTSDSLPNAVYLMYSYRIRKLYSGTFSFYTLINLIDVPACIHLPGELLASANFRITGL